MKTLILTMALFASNLVSFAANNKADENVGKQMRKAFAQSQNLQWAQHEHYSEATFSFNNKKVAAFKNEYDDLIGFSIQIQPSDLPSEALTKIENKFKGWTVINAVSFYDASGYMSYYATAIKNGHSLTLHITLRGSVSIYAKN